MNNLSKDRIKPNQPCSARGITYVWIL